MEDMMKFLLVIAVIAFGVFRQFGKEKEKAAKEESPMPVFEEEPLLEVLKKSKTKKQKKSLYDEGRGVTKNSATNTSAPPLPTKEKEVEGEFSIHSIEESRRAIIWAEILNRKY